MLYPGWFVTKRGAVLNTRKMSIGKLTKVSATGKYNLPVAEKCKEPCKTISSAAKKVFSTISWKIVIINRFHREIVYKVNITALT